MTPQPSQPTFPPGVYEDGPLADRSSAPAYKNSAATTGPVARTDNPTGNRNIADQRSVNSTSLYKPPGTVRSTKYRGIIKLAEQFQVMAAGCTALSPLTTLDVLGPCLNHRTFSAILFTGRHREVLEAGLGPGLNSMVDARPRQGPAQWSTAAQLPTTLSFDLEQPQGSPTRGCGIAVPHPPEKLPLLPSRTTTGILWG